MTRTDQGSARDWQPIETAPKDGTTVDIWAKRWRAGDDSFSYQRFTDCLWNKGDNLTGRKGSWFGISDGWFPTHWMPLPPAPSEPRTR